MNELLEREAKLAKRGAILEFEDMLSQREDAMFGNVMPLKHIFTPGIYTREIFLPAGAVLTGRIHRFEHPYFLMAGVADVFTEENGMERIEAPVYGTSPAGVKRAIHVIEDTIWITIHANPDDIEDIDILEDMLATDSYEDIYQEDAQ